MLVLLRHCLAARLGKLGALEVPRLRLLVVNCVRAAIRIGPGPQFVETSSSTQRAYAARMRAASTAALRALSTPTHATGTPGGIWTIDSSASSPPAIDVRLVSGTPI